MLWSSTKTPSRAKREFLIDHREKRTIKSWAKTRGGKVEKLQVTTADVGDFKCFDRDRVEYRFERKTLTDYERSRDDGRLHAQQRRLKEKKGPKTVVGYILEGLGVVLDKSIRRSIWRLAMDPDFVTVHTRDHIETVEFIPKYAKYQPIVI